MIRKKYWGSWGQSEAPVFPVQELRLPSRVTRQVHKNIKICFQTVIIVWGDFCPQNPIPGKILILLDTHDLSVSQTLPKLDIATFAICHLPFLASLDLVIFDVQTSYGCLKVSEFYKESDS